MMNSVIHGDCLELMKDIPNKSIDMILCDLPYNQTKCEWDCLIDLNFLWFEYKRIIKPFANIVLTATQPFTTKLINSNLSMFKYIWYWNKQRCYGASFSKHQPLRCIEEILIFNHSSSKYNPQMTLAENKNKRNRENKGLGFLRVNMLANFEPSFKKLMENEGGYANLKGDSGGETYKGISRNNFPDWDGWEIIDKIKAEQSIKFAAGASRIINIFAGKDEKLQDLVQTFYYVNFWQKVQGNSLPTPIDFIVFDFAVNAGVRAGVKILQRALMIQDDGIIGNQTKAKIAGIADVSSIVQALKVNIKKYYESLNQPRFIKGWLARVENNFKGLA